MEKFDFTGLEPAQKGPMPYEIIALILIVISLISLCLLAYRHRSIIYSVFRYICNFLYIFVWLSLLVKRKALEEKEKLKLIHERNNL